MEYYILSEKEKDWINRRLEDKTIVIIQGENKNDNQ